MSDKDQRWEFRSQHDLDSSSDDQSIPNFAQDPKLKKHKRVSNRSSREDNKETNDNTNADPSSEGKLSLLKTNKERNPSKGKGKMQKPKRSISSDNYNNPFDAALNDLRGYAESLMEAITVARKGMLDWMSKEMDMSNKNHTVPSKPNMKPTRNNLAKSKRKSGTSNRNPNSGSSETIKDKTDDQVIETPMETKNGPVITTFSASMEKKKRKRVVLSGDRSKDEVAKVDKQSNKVTVPDNYLTLPTIMARAQTDISEKSVLEDGIERGDGAYGQNGGLRNVSDHYEQSRGIGNGNRNGFLFPFTHSMNSGIGIPNTNQFGVQFLNREHRMNGGIMRLPSGNHTFLQNYGLSDQHLRFQVQSEGTELQSCPDMRRANFQPR